MASSRHLKVLIVEDEWLIAEFLQETLEEAGFIVCGPVPRVSDAMKILEAADIDIAVLDVNLRSETSLPVAKALADRSIPFLFMTGYVNTAVLGEFNARPVLNKPVDAGKLISRVKELLSARRI